MRRKNSIQILISATILVAIGFFISCGMGKETTSKRSACANFEEACPDDDPEQVDDPATEDPYFDPKVEGATFSAYLQKENAFSYVISEGQLSGLGIDIPAAAIDANQEISIEADVITGKIRMLTLSGSEPLAASFTLIIPSAMLIGITETSYENLQFNFAPQSGSEITIAGDGSVFIDPDFRVAIVIPGWGVLKDVQVVP